MNTANAKTLQNRRRFARQRLEIFEVVRSLPPPGGLDAAEACRPVISWLPAAAPWPGVDWAAVPSSCDPGFTLDSRDGGGAATASVLTGVSADGSAPLEQPQQHHSISAPGATPSRGWRKRWQVESFLLVLQRLLPPREAPYHLVDFGCGTGALALALAALLPHCRVTGVEMKPAAGAIARRRAAEAGLTNFRCVVGMIEDFEEPLDVALALHACGNATDWALLKAVEQRAAFLVSPCCVGKLKFSVLGGSSFSRSSAVWTPTLPGDRPIGQPTAEASMATLHGAPADPGAATAGPTGASATAAVSAAAADAGVGDAISIATAAAVAERLTLSELGAVGVVEGATAPPLAAAAAAAEAAAVAEAAAPAGAGAAAAADAGAAAAGKAGAAAAAEAGAAAAAAAAAGTFSPVVRAALCHPRSAWLQHCLTDPHRHFKLLAKAADTIHATDPVGPPTAVDADDAEDLDAAEHPAAPDSQPPASHGVPSPPAGPTAVSQPATAATVAVAPAAAAVTATTAAASTPSLSTAAATATACAELVPGETAPAAHPALPAPPAPLPPLLSHSAMLSLCQLHVEIDRCEAAREAGYDAGIFGMLHCEVMAKGHLLVGVAAEAERCWQDGAHALLRRPAWRDVGGAGQPASVQ